MKTIAYTLWNKNTIFYVSDLKGKKGDWGYTTEASKAIDLTPYEQKKFNSDCNACGSVAQFLTLKD